MTTNTRKLNGGSLFTGLVLITLGVLFLLQQFDAVEFGNIMSLYWPMIIVFLGFSNLFERKTVWNGLWLIVVGAWLQAARLHLFGLTFRSSWPLLMIVFGAGLVVRAIFEVGKSSAERNHGA